MAEKIRVLLVDDSASIAETYRALLEREADMECVGVLGTAGELEAAVARDRPGVVVLDLTMPGRSPLEALRALMKRDPGVRVLAFSGHDDAQTETRAFEAGAWGLVSKHGGPREVIGAIRAVARGETVFASLE